MSDGISLILADSNPSYLKTLESEMFKAGIDVLATTDDGVELLELIKEKRPESVVMDIILKNLDGIEVLASLGEQGLSEKDGSMVIMINSLLDSQAVVDKTINMGASYYFRKPVLHSEIARRLKMMCSENHEFPREYDLDADNIKRDRHIATMLKKVGVPVHLIGYKYLLAAIKHVCDDSGTIDNISATVYPAVAKQFDTTPVRVERSIRYAVEAAFDKGYADEVERMFGYTVNSLKGKPTNSEFIAMAADNVLMI